MMTRFGPLDLLGTIGRDHDYAELLPSAALLRLGDERQMRVLNLERLIQTKEEVGGDKDKAVLPILRRTLEEKNRL